MNTTIPLRSVLLTLGALLLLLVLWKLAFVIATLAVPLLFVWLLLSWNHPQRAKALFGQSASKGLVRAGLGGAMIACALFASATASSRSGAGTRAPRLAQNNGVSGEDGSTPSSAPAVNDAAAKLRAHKAEERIRVAENRVRLAEIAERRAKRAQERLEQKQRQEETKKRETLAEEKREREQKKREAARLAALPTTMPIDPNAPEKDILGYHKISATANVSRYGVEFVNNDPFDYTEVYVTLNPTLLGGFRCDYAPLQIPSGQKVFVSFQRFFDGNSRRFSIVDYKLTKIILTCRTKYGKGSGTFTFTGDVN